MNRRRGWMFFVLGLILALSAGALVFVVLRQQEATAAEVARQQSPAPPSMKLPVAARPLEPGQTITTEDYQLKDFPLDLVPVNAITETTSLDNKVLVQPVGQGETFQTSQILGGQGATLSQQVKQGQVLFAFPIVDLMSKSDVIRAGDHIDLLVTLPLKGIVPSQPDKPDEDLGSATALTLQNIEVFKVLRAAPDDKDSKQEGEPSALMCSVTPADAVILKYAKDSGGVIDFALRSPADTEPFTDVPSIDRMEFSKRYLALPPQQ